MGFWHFSAFPGLPAAQPDDWAVKPGLPAVFPDDSAIPPDDRAVFPDRPAVRPNGRAASTQHPAAAKFPPGFFRHRQPARGVRRWLRVLADGQFLQAATVRRLPFSLIFAINS